MPTFFLLGKLRCIINIVVLYIWFLEKNFSFVLCYDEKVVCASCSEQQRG